MKKSLIIIFISVATLIVVLMLLPGKKAKKILDWTPSYGLSEKKPLDLYVFNNEINKLFEDRKITRVNAAPLEYLTGLSNEKDKVNPTSFIYINDQIIWEDRSIDELLNAVQGGFNGFISTGFLPHHMLEILGLSPFYTSPATDTVSLMLGNKNYSILSRKDLSHFNSLVEFTNKDFSVLGTLKTKKDGLKPNFIKVKYGEGTLLIHLCPYVFSNYYLLRSGSKKYVEDILSEVPGKNIVWFTNEQIESNISKSPLSFILSQEALRNSFYLILAGILLFILFNAKRKQRIVPIIPPITNTSVEFAKTVGNLYFQEGSPETLLSMRITYLRDKIWTEYKINPDLPDEEFVHALSAKTAKDKNLINELVSIMRSVKDRNVQDPKIALDVLDNLIHQIFY